MRILPTPANSKTAFSPLVLTEVLSDHFSWSSLIRFWPAAIMTSVPSTIRTTRQSGEKRRRSLPVAACEETACYYRQSVHRQVKQVACAGNEDQAYATCGCSARQVQSANRPPYFASDAAETCGMRLPRHHLPLSRNPGQLCCRLWQSAADDDATHQLLADRRVVTLRPSNDRGARPACAVAARPERGRRQ